VALIRDAPLVIGDTGPFCRFAETDALDALMAYLGDNLIIVREVEAELNFRADQAEHKALQPYRERDPPYVGRDAIDLDSTTREKVRIIARRWRERAIRRRKPDRGENANVGEIATAFAAQERGLPVLMDDGDGKNFAMSKGLTVYTTEDLLAEMVTQRAIGRRRALLIYQRVYGKDESAFDAAVAAAQAGAT
jgi:predicted nucleic acid-binding protein